MTVIRFAKTCVRVAALVLILISIVLVGEFSVAVLRFFPRSAPRLRRQLTNDLDRILLLLRDLSRRVVRNQ